MELIYGTSSSRSNPATGRDGEEFYRRTTFSTPRELTAKLRRWSEYNHEHPHLALAGKTPAARVYELKITDRTCAADGLTNTELPQP